jgi:hypothetical protein
MQAERDNLSETGQAALDAANAKADSLSQQLQDLNVAVGDADGSDIPTGGGATPADGGTAPADGGATAPNESGIVDGGQENGGSNVNDAPPAGEGTVVNPDEQFAAGEGDARPTA